MSDHADPIPATRKAEILAEAMPYIRRFHGRTMVIKYGGNAMTDDRLKASFAQDVVLLKLVGMNPVVVHGGGPQIETLLSKIGKKGEFVQGMRVTDAETMDIVEMVLGGQVNKEIVELINTAGGKAVGLTGQDGGLIRARKLTIESTDNPGEQIDIGQVGQIDKIDPSVIQTLTASGFIPVIAGLVLATGADPQLLAKRIDELFGDGTISGGMLPKISSALDAAKGGVNSVHIIDGRVDHCVLLEVLTNQGVGTMIKSH